MLKIVHFLRIYLTLEESSDDSLLFQDAFSSDLNCFLHEA
jgi:hypothetical protein